MRRNQSANRDRAVTAITRANQLSALRADALTAIRQIERQLKKNGVNSAQLTAEIATQKEIAESLIPRIKQAESEVADVKRRIREEELRFRKATARALAAEFLINAEVCTENLKHVLAEAEREYPELRRPETAT